MNDDQAPGRRERLERAFLSFLTMLREYADLVVAAGVAVYVATEAGVGNLDGDRLTEATAILLGCLAFAFVRERWTRKRGFEEFSKYLKTIAEKRSGSRPAPPRSSPPRSRVRRPRRMLGR